MQLLIIALILFSLPASAQQASIKRSGDNLNIAFDINTGSMHVPAAEARLLTPVLKSADGRDSILLPPVGIYGRKRYLHYERHELSTSPDETMLRHNRLPDTHHYAHTVEYLPWMDGATLVLHDERFGCCHTMLSHASNPMGRYDEPLTFDHLQPIYVAANADEQVVKELSGSAMIQFVVDRTEVKPDWRDNWRELAKISHSIDTVRSDPDFTITNVWLKGYASPESPYKHNSDLAQGRTESVKQYVQNLYHFVPGIITTDFEPEDWGGLRRYVEASNLDNRQSIIEIMETVEDPDDREAQIKRRFPKQYRFLLENAYPPLRHTEYRITYTVRKPFDVAEIKRRLEKEPSKLTLNDFYLAANTYAPGTDSFKRVFDICVRIYPSSEIANLNAANAALQSGQLEAAEQYLKKAGNSNEAKWARAILLLRQDRIADALPLLKELSPVIPAAKVTLEKINNHPKK